MTESIDNQTIAANASGPVIQAAIPPVTQEFAIEVKQWQLYEQLKLTIGTHVFSASAVVEGFRPNSAAGAQCNGRPSLEHFVAFNKVGIEALTGGTVSVRPAASGSGNFEIVIKAKDGAALTGGDVSAAMDRGKSLHLPAHTDSLKQSDLVVVKATGITPSAPEPAGSGDVQARIDVGAWNTRDTLHVNIGEYAFTSGSGHNKADGLVEFVATNGKAIHALTGGTLMVADGDLVIQGAGPLKGGPVSAVMETGDLASAFTPLVKIAVQQAAGNAADVNTDLAGNLASAPTASEYRINVATWMEHQQFQLTIGDNQYTSYGVWGLDTEKSLAKFVAMNKAPIEALTGGTLSAKGHTLVIHSDKGLTGGEISVHMDEWNGTALTVGSTPAQPEPEPKPPEPEPKPPEPEPKPPEPVKAVIDVSIPPKFTHSERIIDGHRVTNEVRNIAKVEDKDFGGSDASTTATQFKLGFAIDKMVVGTQQVAIAQGNEMFTDTIDKLFKAGGPLANAAHTAALVESGSHLYLVATNNAGDHLGTDDVIVRVTGMTGQFDVSDFV